ncbi:hypothetical protein FWJ32_08905 [Calorimonas adulescens]|uniref:Uncharacterized protein n=1 Tax=Calorimonas adulescens TaxID=2606906 RepID=A0A5D8Q9L4_9THEO|nr:hypothetical protein FWJ32_08905 [Calorimonas adulescens]
MYLLDMLTKNKMTLIVSLPESNIELAQAALKGGADALKVHANVYHKASGKTFGNFEEQKNFYKELLKSGLPVGIVPGTDITCMTQDEVAEAEDMGFSFISMFAHHMPIYMLESKMDKMIAITEDYDIEHIKALNDINADIIEADVITDEPGKRIHVSELMKYKRIINNVNKPVVVPTQRIIIPEEVKYMYDIGVKGIMIGVIVTGNTVDSMEKTTRAFKDAINSL